MIMAGDWIKVQHATPDKQEIDGMANILKIDHDAVFGKCLRLWIWADQQTIDGNALSVTNSFIDRLTFCPGFADALRQVGWLEGRQGRLSIPNFDRHNGQTAKKRAQTTDRVKRLRNDPGVTKALPEKRREEKSINTPLSPPRGKSVFDAAGVDLPFSSEQFCAAWRDWCQHRSEIRKKLTPTSTKQQLEKFAAWGEPRSVIAIRHTIANGWQGIREPEFRLVNGMPATSEAAAARGAEDKKRQREEQHRKSVDAKRRAREEREEEERRQKLQEVINAED